MPTEAGSIGSVGAGYVDQSPRGAAGHPPLADREGAVVVRKCLSANEYVNLVFRGAWQH